MQGDEFSNFSGAKMSVTVEKCIGVVDGGMLILEELQTVTLEGVRVP